MMFLTGCIDNTNFSDQNLNLGYNLVYYKDLLPTEIAVLPEDFYPGENTRETMLEKLTQAVNKTGNIESDVWSGIIRITGDINIDSLTIQPGFVIFIEADSDDQNEGWISSVDPMNPHEFFGENYSFAPKSN